MSNSSSKKILVIDDEKDFANMFAMRLKAMGYKAEVAYGGSTGVEKALSYQPDLIFLDLLMPDIDGWEVCKKLEGDSKAKKIPIIILTATDLKVSRDKHPAIIDVIVKPFDETLLGTMLQKHFDAVSPSTT